MKHDEQPALEPEDREQDPPAVADDADLLDGAAVSDDGADIEDPELLGLLMESLAPVEPPSSLRADLLRALHTETSGASEAVAAAGTAPEATPGETSTGAAAEDPAEKPVERTGEDAVGDHGAVVVPLRRRRRRTVLLRSAAAVVILGVGIGIGTGIGRSTAMSSMASTEHYAHLNQAQDVQRVTDTMPDGHVATLTWSEDMSMTALSLPEAMMAASQGHSLQVWLVKGGTTSSLGLYDPSAGTGFTFLDLMPEDGEQLIITQEPEGGSTQPTGAPLVTFDVNADGTTTQRTTPSGPGGAGGTASPSASAGRA